MKTKLIMTVMGLLLACALVSTSAAQGGRIEGTWDVQVNITDCQTGAVIRSFASTVIYMQGGTLIESTSGIPQALKTPGQGVWAHSTDNKYVSRFKSFSFDPAGNYTGYTIIQSEVTLNSTGDASTSAGTAQVYTPGGVLVFTGCNTTVATRFGL
jgi:hypothetical protein